MADIAKMIEEIKGMTVLELNDLVKRGGYGGCGSRGRRCGSSRG